VRGLLLAAAAALGWVAAAAAAPTEGTIARRTTLIVHDLDASIAFYTTIGFEKWYDGEGGTVSGDGLPVDGATAGDPTRLVIMKGKHPYIGMIGLLQYGPTRQLPGSGRLQAGDAILMIETTGLDAIAQKLMTGGARIHKPVETAHITSVGEQWDAKFLMVFDPDGRMVELTERLN
jgi:catechol 2,3-dioxygenase-like lactoylglutathione lyase family enzyme